ncbi:MAG: 4Fe-4S ferredoxin [Epsilonproteobacteria bacterium]|nr:4Fe-4S ferredoxin [Campylobacterota bacterium]
MSTLFFDAAKCVRSATKFATCEACVTACPVKTVTVAENGLPAFVPADCVDCGGCVGACPTEAFGLKSFDVTDFFFRFIEADDNRLSCRTNVPCLAVFGVEHWVALALLKPEVTADVGHCAECVWREPLYGDLNARIEEANHLLMAVESPHKVLTAPLALEADKNNTPNRRAFLEKLSPREALRAKAAFEEAVEGAMDDLRRHALEGSALARLRQKEIPDRRKLLFVALKRAQKPQTYHTLAEEALSFVSQKFIDDTCTMCQMCYRICPTGALSSDAKNSKIFFDAMLCVKCGACHDTCEPGALHLQPAFELKEFFEPTQRLLARFPLRRCDECGVHFASVEGARVCPRCAVEEEEALDLWGLERKDDGTVAFKAGEERALADWRSDTSGFENAHLPKDER